MRYASRFVNGAVAGGNRVQGRLRAVSPTNSVNSFPPVASSGTVTNIRFRMPFFIGSGDCSQLVLSSYGFYLAAAAVTLLPNAYNWVGVTIEKDSNGALLDVTWGASATKTINAGDTDIQCDPILPGNFSAPMSKFTVGDKYWVRGEYSVASAAQWPQGDLNFNGDFPASIAVKIDPATSTAGPVHGSGNMAQGNGVGFGSPYVPLILGRFVSGDPKTFVYTGDSLVRGSGDTSNNTRFKGSFQRALTDADGVSNPLGGMKMAVDGSLADWWNGTNNALLTPYLGYGKYLYEEFGCNEYLTSPGTAVATAMAKSKVIWDKFTALPDNSVAKILKPKFTPRTLESTAVSSLVGNGTLVTVTTTSAFVATIGGIGATGTCAISGATPAGYNTVATGVTMTVVTSTTMTYSNTTTGAATGTILISDLWATSTNQSFLNAAWASGGNARLFNDEIDNRLSSNQIGTVVQLNALRMSTDKTQDLFYIYLSNGTVNYATADGTHPTPAAAILAAAEIRTYTSVLP
jgi:lysophospholipase L1-like esterase